MLYYRNSLLPDAILTPATATTGGISGSCNPATQATQYMLYYFADPLFADEERVPLSHLREWPLLQERVTVSNLRERRYLQDIIPVSDLMLRPHLQERVPVSSPQGAAARERAPNEL